MQSVCKKCPGRPRSLQITERALWHGPGNKAPAEARTVQAPVTAIELSCKFCKCFPLMKKHMLGSNSPLCPHFQGAGHQAQPCCVTIHCTICAWAFSCLSFGDKFLHPVVGDRGAGAVSEGHLDKRDVFVQVFL